MFRFTIRDVLLVMALAGLWTGLVAGWLANRPGRAHQFGQFVELGDVGVILAAATIAALALRMYQGQRTNS